MRPNRTGIRGLYKDTDGRYRIDLRHEAGRYKERLAPGISAAAARLHAQKILELALAGKLLAGTQGAPGTLKGAFTAYLDWIKGAGAGEYVDPARTHADKKLHVDSWLKVVGDIPLGTLGRATFDLFKAKRKADLVARTRKLGATDDELTFAGNATVNRALTTMKHFVRVAGQWGWIPKDRAVEIRTEEIELLAEPDGRVRWLKDGERARLEAALPRELEAVVLADVYSGLRLSNVIKLRKHAVDLKHRTLSVVRTKSGKRLDLPINDTLARILETAMARSKTEFVFVNRRGKPYTRNGVSSFFLKKVAQAGIKDFSYHDLRHDYATRLLRNGVHLNTVSKLLGHGSLAMTQRYAHLEGQALRAAVAVLDSPTIVAPVLPPTPRRRRRK